MNICESIVLRKREVLFGVVENKLANHVIVICKDIISHKIVLDIKHVESRMRIEKEAEMCIAEWSGSLESYREKWNCLT